MIDFINIQDSNIHQSKLTKGNKNTSILIVYLSAEGNFFKAVFG